MKALNVFVKYLETFHKINILSHSGVQSYLRDKSNT